MRYVALLLLLGLAAPAPADDALFPPGSTRPAAPSVRCDDGMYMTPSLHVSTVEGPIMGRLGSGIIHRGCNQAKTSAIHYSLGLSAYVADEDAGIGVELEVTVPVLGDARLGGRFSVENAAQWGHVVTAGVRFQAADTFILAADAFYVTDNEPSMFDRTEPVGVSFGVGVTGIGGWVIGGPTLVLGLLFLAAASTSS